MVSTTKISRLILALSMCLFLSSCTDAETVPQVQKLEDVEVTLKIAIPSPHFEVTYRSIIEKKYPKLTLEFIREDYIQHLYSGEWKEWLEIHQPDLIVSQYPGMFTKLVRDGLLVPLDPLIKRDNVDLDLYVPGVIDWLRLQDENRQLYGMALEYRIAVLAYNTEHFDRLGIPYPSERITWSELLQLAQRFQGDQVYGLQVFSITPSRLIADIGRTEELRLFDMETGEVFARTEEWKSIWEQVLQAYQSGEIKFDYGELPTDAAMAVQYIRSPWEVVSSSWKLAYYPIQAEKPNETHRLEVHRPISIYNQSLQQDYAWELLKFIISEEMFRYGGSSEIGIPNRMETVTNYSFENAHVLYDVNPKVNTIPDISGLDSGSELYDLADRIFEEVAQGSMTLDEGLEQYEREIGELLEKYGLVDAES